MFLWNKKNQADQYNKNQDRIARDLSNQRLMNPNSRAILQEKALENPLDSNQSFLERNFYNL